MIQNYLTACRLHISGTLEWTSRLSRLMHCKPHGRVKPSLSAGSFLEIQLELWFGSFLFLLL